MLSLMPRVGWAVHASLVAWLPTALQALADLCGGDRQKARVLAFQGCACCHCVPTSSASAETLQRRRSWRTPYPALACLPCPSPAARSFRSMPACWRRWCGWI